MESEMFVALLTFLLVLSECQCKTADVQYGDLMIRSSQYSTLLGKEPLKQRSFVDKFGTWKNYKLGRKAWLIPYSIDRSIKNRKFQANIHAAIREFQDNTCLTFLRRKKEHKFYILFSDSGSSSGCRTYLGQGKLSEQPDSIVLNSKTCMSKGTILHLMMHKLGFVHEHQRTDRDNFVSIHYSNIRNGLERVFEITPGANSFKMPYDFGSILQIPSTYLSIDNSRPTITKKDGSKITEYQQNHLSPIDVAKINELYSCPADPICKDKLSAIACEIRRKRGICGSKPNLMKKRCSATCGFCKCKDHKPCRHVKLAGVCTIQPNISQMQTDCPLTCGYCGKACVDVIKNCARLVKNGKCEGNPARLSKVCRQTCGYCVDTDL